MSVKKVRLSYHSKMFRRPSTFIQRYPVFRLLTLSRSPFRSSTFSRLHLREPDWDRPDERYRLSMFTHDLPFWTWPFEIQMSVFKKFRKILFRRGIWWRETNENDKTRSLQVVRNKNWIYSRWTSIIWLSYWATTATLSSATFQKVPWRALERAIND